MVCGAGTGAEASVGSTEARSSCCARKTGALSAKASIAAAPASMSEVFMVASWEFKCPAFQMLRPTVGMRQRGRRGENVVFLSHGKQGRKEARNQEAEKETAERP